MVSDSNEPRDGEDRRLRPPRPGKSVDPEKSLNMAESFEVFTDEIRALNSTMRQMSSDIKNTLDMQARYTTDRRRQEDLHGARESVADHPAETGDATMGVGRNAMNMWNWQQQHRMSGREQEGLSMGPSFDYFIDPGQRLTGTEGTQSLSHFRTWAAQVIGEKVAGHRQVFNPDLLGGEAGGEALHERPGISRFRNRLINEENKRRKRRRPESESVQDAEHEEFSTHQGPIPDETPPDEPAPESEERQPRHSESAEDPGRTTDKNIKRPKVSDPKATDYVRRESDGSSEGPDVDPHTGRVSQRDLESETSSIRDSERPDEDSGPEASEATPKGVSTVGERATEGQTTPEGAKGAQRESDDSDRAGQVRPREADQGQQPDQATPDAKSPTTASPGVPTDPGVGRTHGSEMSPQDNEVRAEQQSPTAGQTNEAPDEQLDSGEKDISGIQTTREQPGIPTDPNAGQVIPREKEGVGEGEARRDSSAQPRIPTDPTPDQVSGGGTSEEVPGATEDEAKTPYVGRHRSEPDHKDTVGQTDPRSLSDPRDTEYAQPEPGTDARRETPEGPPEGTTTLSGAEAPDETDGDATPGQKPGTTPDPVRPQVPRAENQRVEPPHDSSAGQTEKQESPETPGIPTDPTSGQTSSGDIAGGRDGEPDSPGSDPVWPSDAPQADHTAGYVTPSELAADDSSESFTTPVSDQPRRSGVSDPRQSPYSQAEPGERARQESEDGPADGSTVIPESEEGEGTSSTKEYIGRRRRPTDSDPTAGQTGHREGPEEPSIPMDPTSGQTSGGDKPGVSDPKGSEYAQPEPGERARQEAPEGPSEGTTALSGAETTETSSESAPGGPKSEGPAQADQAAHSAPGKRDSGATHDPTAGQTTPETLAGGEGGGGEGEPPVEGEPGAEDDGGGGMPPGGFAVASAALGRGSGSASISAARTRIGSAIAQSGGTGAGLSMALRRMPVVGLGVEAVNQGTKFYQNQREQGRQYQSMTGTSGAEGWVDKRQEDLYRWQNFFKFDGGRSREQFQTATAAGYNDLGADAGIQSQSRDGALNFMDRSYHEVGMDTDESGKHLDAAARNTFTPLNDLVDTLGRLSESAGQAGINAEKARESFGNMFSNITGMGYGESAMQGAATLQQAQTNFGKQFEDMDMSAMYAPEAQILAAAQSGMGYGEIQHLALTDPNEYLSQVSGAQQDIMGSIDPEVQAAVEELSAGKDLESEAEVQSIRDELLERFPDKDWNTMAMVASQFTGMQMGPEEYITWMIKTYGGHGLDEAIEEEEEHKAAMESGSASEIAGAGGSGAQKALQDKDDPGALGYFFPEGDTELQGKSNEEAAEKLKQWYEEGDEGERGFGQLSEKDEYEAASALEMSKWGSDGKSFGEGLWGGIVKDFTRGQAAESQYMTDATNQYFKKYTQQGKGDPFLESLLQETKDHDTKVKVPIAGGGDRVVSLEEAVQHYGPQLSSGEVEFVEGDLAGKTTSEVAGMEGTGELEAAGDEKTTQENLDELGVGEDYETWAKDNPEEAEKIKEREEAGGEAGEGGTTMIDLTPEAKRIFQIQSGEGDPASASGMPNDPGQGQMNQRGGTSFPLGN